MPSRQCGGDKHAQEKRCNKPGKSSEGNKSHLKRLCSHKLIHTDLDEGTNAFLLSSHDVHTPEMRQPCFPRGSQYTLELQTLQQSIMSGKDSSCSLPRVPAMALSWLVQAGPGWCLLCGATSLGVCSFRGLPLRPNISPALSCCVWLTLLHGFIQGLFIFSFLAKEIIAHLIFFFK